MKIKHFKTVILLLLILCSITGCNKQKDNLYLGLNAEIVRVDRENKHLIVKDIDEEKGVFGEESVIDCKEAIENKRILYCNYENRNVTIITLPDFQEGNQVIISMYEQDIKNISNGTAKAKQVQLGTQRMN